MPSKDPEARKLYAREHSRKRMRRVRAEQKAFIEEHGLTPEIVAQQERDRACKRRYNASEAGKACQERYWGSEKGAAAKERSLARRPHIDYRDSYHRHYCTPKAVHTRMRLAAKRQGLEFDISVEEIAMLLEPMTCAVTKMPLKWDLEDGANLLSPSFDRKDNAKGYVSGNVQCVARWVNLGRNRASLEDFREVLTRFFLSDFLGTETQ